MVLDFETVPKNSGWMESLMNCLLTKMEMKIATAAPDIGEKPTVFLILTSHNQKAIIVELMSTGGRYILALHQKLIYHCIIIL